MVGAHRQFVHADESIQRLPELALLAGSILSFLAATAPIAPRAWGSPAEKNAWTLSSDVDGQTISAKLSLSRATSQKGFGLCPFTGWNPRSPTEIRAFGLCHDPLRQFVGLGSLEVLDPRIVFSVIF